MMHVRVIETGEVKTLRLIDPESGVDFVQDFVGNGGGFENKDFVYNHEDDVFEATAQAFNWWNQVISDQQELVDRIDELKEEHGSDAVNEVLESVGGHDLEDDAAVVNAALDEAFGEEDERVACPPRHRNIGSFFDWLRDSLKDSSALDSEAGRKEWVKDLETALATTGGNDYEIPARLTKSGNAELYTITREWFTAEDGEEDYLIVH